MGDRARSREGKLSNGRSMWVMARWTRPDEQKEARWSSHTYKGVCDMARIDERREKGTEWMQVPEIGECNVYVIGL